MDPFLGASLVNLGGGVLDAIFSPSQKKQLKWQRESDQKMADWQAGKLQQIKPRNPYYESGNLPQLGDSAMKAVMGNLMSRLGGDTLSKWGIGPTAAPAQAPATQVPPPAAMPPGPMPQRPRGFPGQDILMRRYGVAQ